MTLRMNPQLNRNMKLNPSVMKRTAPTDLNEIAGNPQKFTFYEYPAYTFDRKYENDGFQKRVITIDSGYHLVLAPPGCGKTDILAERVVRALSCGVTPDDMLCLTFTNRAPEVCVPEY